MKKYIIPIAFIFVFSIFFVKANAQVVGDTLTGHYTYFDPEGDPEGVSTFQWYRDGVAIPGATSITYHTTSDDAGKTLVFEVIPVALTGISPGSPIRSTGIVVTTPVVATPTSSSGGYLPGYGPRATVTTVTTPEVTSTKEETTITIPPTLLTQLSTITKVLKSSTKKDNNVKTIQTYLNTALKLKLTPDGVFGKQTKLAIMKFQKDHNLTPDGIVGPKTLKEMK